MLKNILPYLFYSFITFSSSTKALSARLALWIIKYEHPADKVNSYMNQLRESFNQFVETELNPEQKSAATSSSEALIVVAGAGSGKTRVITARILNLILNHDVDPRSIVALTFTNKAAGEMRERLIKFLGTTNRLPFVGTFHAYCLLLLRSNPHLLPFAAFSILDADDQLSLVKKIVKNTTAEKQLTPSQIMYQLSSLKNSLYDTEPKIDTRNTLLIQEIYQKYEAEKAASHLFDFDDLILQVLLLFEKDNGFQESFQRKVRHILVDEYQDTSTVQHTLLKKMALNKEGKYILDSVCAVGDEDQSIYSWRGANVTNMLRFCKDFAPVRTIKLEQNYRSVESILQAANSLITNNKLRNPKTLWSTRNGNNRILNLTCRSGEQEAETIALLLKTLPSSIAKKDVAILYRTHFQSRSIEEALIYHAIPYKIIGGIRFYERKEIKDLLAYLRLLVNPHDKISFLRVMNTPTRGLGKKIESQIIECWHFNPLLDFKQLLHFLLTDEASDVATAHKTGLYKFLELFEGIDLTTKPSDIISTLLERTDYLNYLRETCDGTEAHAKLENIRELIRAIHTFETNMLTSRAALELMGEIPLTQDSLLESFLHEVTLMQEKNTGEETQDQVNMMTLHAAKGLEFSVVVITGLEEGLLPSTKSLNTNDELEEERRLLYVGITRARDYLLLTHAHSRNTYGQFLDQAKSRFMAEIDQKLFHQADIDARHPGMVRDLLNNWLGNKPIPSTLITARTAPKSYLPTKNYQQKPTDTTYSRTKPSSTPTIPSSRPIYTSTPTPSADPQPIGPWNKNQKVTHKKFGMGIITEVEKIGDNEFYVTAIFKLGKKKILSNFLEQA